MLFHFDRRKKSEKEKKPPRFLVLRRKWLTLGAAVLAAKAAMGFGANLRQAGYEQGQRFSFANIEHFSTASLITRLTNDVSSLQMTLMMGMRMLVRAPVMLVTALVMALIISTRLSQVFLVVIPLLVLGVVLVLNPFDTAIVLFRIIGAGLIFSGVSDLVTSLYMAKKVKNYVKDMEALGNTVDDIMNE